MKACLLTTDMFCEREKAEVLIIIQQNDKPTQVFLIKVWDQMRGGWGMHMGPHMVL